MNKKQKLEHLIEIMKTVPEDKLNMLAWDKKAEAWGTICCAAGWAALDPKFNELSFDAVWIDLPAGEPQAWLMPIYNGNCTRGPYAVRTFFEVNDEEYTHIFLPEGYESYDPDTAMNVLPVKITPSQVITHIQEVIDGKEI